MKFKIIKIVFSFAFVYLNINLTAQQSYFNKEIDSYEFVQLDDFNKVKIDNTNKEQSAKSEVTVTAMNVSDVAGSTVTIPIYITDVTDLASFQFSIEYDNTQLSYNSCDTWMVPGGVTIQEPTPGHLTFVWAVAVGADYPAGLFFNLVMDIDGAATGMIGIQWSDDPTTRLVGNSSATEISSSWINGSVTVTGTTNPSLTISDVITTTSTAVSVPVNVTDLFDLCAFQWTINYDATRLAYTGCSNWATGIDTDPGLLVINDDGAGTLTIAYNNYPNGIDIANGKFFDLNFTTNVTTGVAPVTWSSSPTTQELSNCIPAIIPATWNDGSVTISTTPTIIIETVNGVAGNPVVVPVDAINLVNMAAFQWTIDYDETKLTYTGCSNWATGIDTDPSFLLINDDGDKLTFAYNNYPNTIDIANGKFFDLNFTIDIAATGEAPVIWADDPTPRELSDDVPNEIPADWTDGKVIITAASDAVITIDEVFGIAGNPVTVPVNAFNMNNMSAFQWTIDYDETRLTYTGCSDWATGIDTDPAFLLINDDGSKLTFAYNNYPTTVTIADGLFFNLNFNVSPGATGIAPVIWSDDPTPRELSDDVPFEITTTWVDGRVIIDLSWDGSTDTDWQDVTNWTPEYIPTSTIGAIVPAGCPNYPIIDDGALTAETYNLRLDAGGTLTVAPNGQMTVHGTFTNNATSADLVLRSDATGDGSLIHSNTGVSATVEKYIPGTRYHYIGSPIIGATSAGIGIATTQFYAWNPTLHWNGMGADPYGTPSTIDYIPWGSTYSGNLDLCTGYAYYHETQTLQYVGEVNVATYDLTLRNSGADPIDYDQGWNLISNPYSASLNWDIVVSTDWVANVESAIYLFDDSDGSGYQTNYRYYVPAVPGSGLPSYPIGTTEDATAQIPIGQGFFVRTSVDGENLKIEPSDRVHGTQAFYKSQKYTYPNLLRLNINSSETSDELIVRLIDGASFDYDALMDARKLIPSNPTIPQVFAVADAGDYISINTIPLYDDTSIVMLAVVAMPGNFTFTQSEFTFDVGRRVFLHDKQLETFTLIDDNFSYEFYFEGGMNATRFELAFMVNHAPYVNSPIEDMSTLEDDFYEYFIDDQTFSDVDNDNLLYTCSLSDGSLLPDWLNFDENTFTFSGTPLNEDVGVYSIKITATDEFEASVSLDFSLEVVNTNDEPILNIPISDYEVTVNEELSFVLPENTFIDIDLGDELSYFATYNGGVLPDWLQFDAQTLRFNGIPTSVEPSTYEITLFATDLSGATSKDIFVINVKEGLELNELDNNVIVHPNPTDGFFSLSVNNFSVNYNVNIYDATGKLIYSENVNSNESEFDFSQMASGVYTIEVILEDQTTIVKKLIRK